MPRLFLDLFAGTTSPLTAAAKELNLDSIEPIDALANPKHNVLDDCFYAILQRLCWSGLVSFIWSAPPCEQQQRVDSSAEIHARSRALVRAATAKGADGGFEQPVDAMSWLEHDNVQLLCELNATCAHVAACAHGLNIHKAWVFCCTLRETASLASVCKHHRDEHTSVCNKRDSSGAFTSSTTAKYPSTLAKALLTIAQPRISSTGLHSISLQHALSLLPVSMPPHPRLLVCDGSGQNSTADHSLPSNDKRMSKLREAFMSYVQDNNLMQQLATHLSQAKDTHPLSEKQQLDLACLAHAIVHPGCTDTNCLSIREDQPFRLLLLQAIAQHVDDPDLDLIPILLEGVPTGAFTPLPASKQWITNQLSDPQESDPLHLQHCAGNWTQAEKNPAVLQELIDKELREGYIAQFDGTEADAKRRWPKGTAIGKLNVVIAQGRDPRMVLDSTICNLNPRCHLPERVQMPTAKDVQLTYSHRDPHGYWHGLSLDFKAAHKACVVREDERGTLLFRHQHKLYYYKVCHFGARFSSFWWQRLGSVIHRTLHRLLSHRPHRSFLYVDDIFAMLCAKHSAELACLTICLLTAINAPISWRKAQLGPRITWCGWTFDLANDTLQLVHTKIAKLLEQLAALRRASKVHRKALEACLGLLVWATTMSPHLRPFLAPLYSDLHSGKGTLHSVPATQWQQFYQALDDQARVQNPAGMWLPKNAQLLEVGSIPISCKADVPRVPKTSQRTWVRLADPSRHEVHLRKQSKEALLWLEQMFKHSNIAPLHQPQLLQCLSAADAMAEGNQVGIGGWMCTSRGFAWFSETWTMQEVRATWPALTDSAQPYIACFEVLAQLALLQTAWLKARPSSMSFILPTASDNTAAESGINKLFSTTEPLASFLKLVADWAHRHSVQLAVSHLAGEKNVWADELSRNRMHRFQHRMHERVRIPLQMLAERCHCIHLHPPDAFWASSLLAASA